MKHIFIVNPTSGNGQYKKLIDQIKLVFKDREDYEIIMTEYPKHAAEIAARFDDNHRLYCIGGDGTAHEVLNGVRDGVQVGFIPAGSGNDFLRNLEPKRDVDNIISNIIVGESVPIDVVSFNGKKQLNCANIGLDTDVNQMVNDSSLTLIPRRMLYMLYAIKALILKKSTTLFVEHDGIVKEYEVLLATFMNGQYYGGGFKAAPLANLQDGYFDVTLVGNISRLRIMRLLPIYFKGKHLGIDVVTNFQAKHIKVHSKTDVLVGCDGETEMIKEIEMSILPEGLNLIIPKGSALKGNQI